MAQVLSPAGLTEDDRVTIVVASRNRREELLASLARHRAPVVYVDNASEDGSPDAVREAFPQVEVVALPRNVGAFARTIGVRRATTPVVAFADDDSWWAPGSLAAGAEILAAHPDAGLLNARILVGTEERLDPTCAEMACSPLPRPAGAPGEQLLGFIACGAMVRTAAFVAAGGFDPVVRFPGEEERLSLDLAQLGYLACYVPELVVHHHPSPIRSSPHVRHLGLARSAVLTAALRLPLPWLAGRFWRSVTGGPATRRGAVGALSRLPAALRHRRPVAGHVLSRVELLHRTPPAGAGQRPVGAGTETGHDPEVVQSRGGDT